MKEFTYNEILRERNLRLMENPYIEMNYSPEMTTLPVIGIDQIRAIKQDLALKLLEGRYRVILISRAEFLTIAASNSLLKLLEEPPENTIFFLTTSILSRILATIVSRCQSIRLDLLGEEEIEAALIRQESYDQIQSRFLARMAGGSYRRALSLAEGGFEEKRESAQAFLEWSLKKDMLGRIDYTTFFHNRWDKVEILDTFQILMVWLRDVMQMNIDHSSQLINSDRSHEIEQFIVRWPKFDAEMGLVCVERAIDFIEKNVYLPLVVFQLSHDFGKCAR
jgi:DNA polymerase-3 subunit delta'